ncbi:MAG: glycosyltransferase family 4 protein [Chlorobiaceae bacterium]|nr:glycosyltransferase family 4 protein [Chlorobiaceae bacterium]
MSYLPVLFGYHASNIGNSHVPLSLCRFWNDSGRSSRLVVPSADEAIAYPWLDTAMTGIRKSVVYRFGGREQPRTLAEEHFFRKEKSAPLVYLWAGLSLDIFLRFKNRGASIIIERINCHRSTSRRILREAAEHWGLPFDQPDADMEIAEENRKLEMADAVFCPSPLVTGSMIENGVPERKLLQTSYGWAPERFPSMLDSREPNPKPVFLFAGLICLRKGIPLLLEAWKKADIDGELLLCGAIDDSIRDRFGADLQGKNIRHIPYTRNIGEIYRMADVFVFPSLEEGGPMVTYEAMAHGLPPIVTAMGGGAIVQDGTNGLVLPDLDVDAWAAAITRLAEQHRQRAELGAKAMERARQFTWQCVAEQRASLLQVRYPELWK